MNCLNSFISAILLIALLTACDDNSRLSLNQRSVIYCSEGSPDTFNPQLVTSGTTIDATSKQLYNKLIAYQGDENNLVPALAKSWHVTRDGKKVTFYLRKNVSFHQTDYFTPTRHFNADDVLFSFNRIIDHEHPFHLTSGGHYPFFQNIEFDSLIKKIEKINDYTIRFHLTRADNNFLANLATDFAVILSAQYAEKLNKNQQKQNIDIHPIGTGPFKLKEYRVGSLIRFYHHKAYWQGSAKIEQLVFDITSSNTGRLTKLLAKECDISSYPIAHNKITQRSDLTLESVTALNVGYFGFNTTQAPFNNILVRQAMAFAINKQVLLDTVYQGQAELAKSILPETSWAYDKTSKEQAFNLDKAKTLLAQAGYPDGFTMDLWAMPVQRPYNPNAITMAKLIQADLKKININVDIVSYEWNTFLHRLAQGEHQSFLLGWSADHPDPDNFFTPMLSCAASHIGSNRTFWCNQDYDDIIHKALETNNIEQRKQLYTQANAILNKELPLIPIAHSKRYQARGNNIVGKTMGPFGGISFYQVKKSPLTIAVKDETVQNKTKTKKVN
ncbi:MAG: ABC transporter substrate-binding protein [Litorilituus sp.]|jgi:cationic peptide transport system substrate-binding protein|nr:ABC transporter substrate-binding protein [Litorilituus sp.]